MTAPIWIFVYRLSLLCALVSVGHQLWPDGWLRPFNWPGLLFTLGTISAAIITFELLQEILVARGRDKP